MTMTIDPQRLKGRNRRLYHEWQLLQQRLSGRSDIVCQPVARNAAGLPVQYRVDYYLRSICGVEDVDHLDDRSVSHRPRFARHFVMVIELPDSYPCVDGQPVFRFLTTDEEGQPIPHPWHPNIRYFGQFAGRVCLNRDDTYTDLVWGVERIALYLRYERYHALAEPPYPEDQQVAAWVIRQGEPNEWIFFNQDEQ